MQYENKNSGFQQLYYPSYKNRVITGKNGSPIIAPNFAAPHIMGCAKLRLAQRIKRIASTRAMLEGGYMIIFRSLPRGAVVLSGLLTLSVILCADLSSASAQTPSALPQHVTSDEQPEDIDDVLNRVFGQMSTVLQNAIYQAGLRGEIPTERKLTIEDLTRLDFSLPGDPDFDETSPYSVVRMLKKSALSLYPDNVFVSQKDLDRLTTVKGTRLIFNVRRVRSQGGKANNATVYWLLPNFNPWFCESSFVKASGVRIGPYPLFAAQGFVIAPDNHTIIEDEQEIDPESQADHHLPDTCIYMPDGQVYRVSFLFRLQD